MRVRFGSRSTRSGTPATTGGKIAGTLFLSVFFFAGLFFAVLLVREFMADMASRNWITTPCRIVTAEVVVHENNDDPFTCRIHYTYTYKGQEFSSHSIYRKKESKAYEYYDRAARILDDFPPGSQRNCYVNPKAPGESILLHGSPWFILFIILPLIFMAVGGGIPIAMWRDRGGSGKAGFESLSEKATGKKSGKKPALLFFVVFAALGAGFFFPIFGKALLREVQARSWAEVPCTVLYSRLRSHTDDDGTTYRADIFYGYEVQGREYKSNRVRFLGGSSSGTEGKRKLLKQYPPRSERTCFVNPGNPRQAVLVRGFHPLYLVSLLPLVFLVIGIGGLLGMFGSRHRNPDYYRASSPAGQPGLRAYDPAAWNAESGVTLKPQAGPWKKLIGVIFIALFWNGIVSLLVKEVIDGWMNGRGSFFMTLFALPFVLVGLALLAGVVYQFVALFNPRVTLTVSHAAVPLGERLSLSWQLKGSPSSVRRFQLYISGTEEVRYRRGTDTRTDTRAFMRLDLVDTTDAWDMANGSLDMVLPDEAMPSFEAPNNRIKWSICIRGDISRRPDIKEDYPVQVLPKPVVRS